MSLPFNLLEVAASYQGFSDEDNAATPREKETDRKGLPKRAVLSVIPVSLRSQGPPSIPPRILQRSLRFSCQPCSGRRRQASTFTALCLRRLPLLFPVVFLLIVLLFLVADSGFSLMIPSKHSLCACSKNLFPLATLGPFRFLASQGSLESSSPRDGVGSPSSKSPVKSVSADAGLFARPGLFLRRKLGKHAAHFSSCARVRHVTQSGRLTSTRDWLFPLSFASFLRLHFLTSLVSLGSLSLNALLSFNRILLLPALPSSCLALLRLHTHFHETLRKRLLRLPVTSHTAIQAIFVAPLLEELQFRCMIQSILFGLLVTSSSSPSSCAAALASSPPRPNEVASQSRFALLPSHHNGLRSLDACTDATQSLPGDVSTTPDSRTNSDDAERSNRTLKPRPSRAGADESSCSRLGGTPAQPGRVFPGLSSERKEGTSLFCFASLSEAVRVVLTSILFGLAHYQIPQSLARDEKSIAYDPPPPPAAPLSFPSLSSPYFGDNHRTSTSNETLESSCSLELQQSPFHHHRRHPCPPSFLSADSLPSRPLSTSSGSSCFSSPELLKSPQSQSLSSSLVVSPDCARKVLAPVSRRNERLSSCSSSTPLEENSFLLLRPSLSCKPPFESSDLNTPSGRKPTSPATGMSNPPSSSSPDQQNYYQPVSGEVPPPSGVVPPRLQSRSYQPEELARCDAPCLYARHSSFLVESPGQFRSSRRRTSSLLKVRRTPPGRKSLPSIIDCIGANRVISATAQALVWGLAMERGGLLTAVCLHALHNAQQILILSIVRSLLLSIERRKHLS